MYNSIEDLPKGMTSNLPHDAQKTYLEAYTRASQQFAEHVDVHALAHRTAWSEMKQEYEMFGHGKWLKIEKKDGNGED